MKTVYMCFSTDVLHSAHINIIKKAAELGRLTVGVLTDEAVASYKRFPLVSLKQRMEMIKNVVGVAEVVVQDALDYEEILQRLKPTYLVHGDDWRTGVQSPVRERALHVLNEYGGQLIEFPYDMNDASLKIEKSMKQRLAIPDMRRGLLKKLLEIKKFVRIIEAHNGITGLIAEESRAEQDGKIYQFDGMWVSSLCDSTSKGKPDIELVDMSSRIRTIDDIMEVTTKPIHRCVPMSVYYRQNAL